MAKPYYLLSDPQLLAWSASFSDHLTTSPVSYGITADQAAQYASLQTEFVFRLGVWQNPATRTPVTRTEKDASRAALIEAAKYLVNTINSNPATTDAKRNELNIPIRKKPTPIPTPSQSPMIDVAVVSGRSVTLQLHNNSPKRGKPAGVTGASVFSFVGPTPSEDISAWKFEGSTTKTEFAVTFDASLAPGTKVWITAFWFNPKAESGPAAQPVGTQIQFGGMTMPTGMKIAA